MGIKSKRVAFTFDDAAVKKLEELTRDGPLPKCPCCGQPDPGPRWPRRAVVLRDPETKKEKVIHLPQFNVPEEERES